jgi:hypothetical protein
MRLSKVFITIMAAALAACCGPDVEEDVPPGELVYADAFKEIYRLDRRVEVVAVDPHFVAEGCGYLTDRAYEDIEATVEALDPSKDYVADPEMCQALERIYIEGFEHSPFECYWMCCHPDLVPIALAYFAIFETLYGQPPRINDEIYVALEPDRPCE